MNNTKIWKGGAAMQMPPDVFKFVQDRIIEVAANHGAPFGELFGQKRMSKHAKAREEICDFFMDWKCPLSQRRFNGTGEIRYHLDLEGNNPPEPASKWHPLSTTILAELLGKDHTAIIQRHRTKRKRLQEAESASAGIADGD